MCFVKRKIVSFSGWIRYFPKGYVVQSHYAQDGSPPYEPTGPSLQGDGILAHPGVAICKRFQRSPVRSRCTACAARAPEWTLPEHGGGQAAEKLAGAVILSSRRRRSTSRVLDEARKQIFHGLHPSAPYAVTLRSPRRPKGRFFSSDSSLLNPGSWGFRKAS
jgi:hypothetical protein